MKGNVSGYVCNHGSPSGERDTASPRLWAMLRTQASDEEADDVCSRRHLYCDTPVVTSWAVAGQQVVFLHMYLQTRVTLEAFPVATPRGRSVSFPTRGTMDTYVTWDVFLYILNTENNFNLYFVKIFSWKTVQIVITLKIILQWFYYIVQCNLFLWCKAVFSASLLQSSVSHDPSENWFATQ